MENDNARVEDLPLDDLTPFITRTTPDHVGGGAFGDVWKCNYSADGISALVAVKAFRVSGRFDLEKINRKIRREIGILKILHHGNIVPLLGIATGFGRMPELRCLVSPWMPNGTLNDYLAFNHDDLTVLDRSNILEDVSAGLQYLHLVSVIHGDITGANILIDEGGHARLIDFGLSTIVLPLLGQSHLAATSIHPGAIRYAAPELVLSDDDRALEPSKKTDIYSFGCVMLQVLSGRHPWSEIKEKPEVRIVVIISEGRGPQRPDDQPAIIDSDWDFIQRCLQFRPPELRPSADEVHDFVMHRCSSDSSGPSNDPPDDARYDLPRAFPHDSSDESDTTEPSPNSPSLHPDHELTTSIIEPRAQGSSAYSSPPSLGGTVDRARTARNTPSQTFEARGGGSIYPGPTGYSGPTSYPGPTRATDYQPEFQPLRQDPWHSRGEPAPHHRGTAGPEAPPGTGSRPSLPSMGGVGAFGIGLALGIGATTALLTERKPSVAEPLITEPPARGYRHIPSSDHPRTALNNLLQIMYGQTTSDRVRWKTYSQGPPNALQWSATIYIDDISYGGASARTRGAAQDMAAATVIQVLRSQVIDNSSASSSASSSNTPAHSISRFFREYDYLSGGLSESSRTPEHSGRSLSEMFLCMWGGPNGLHCNHSIRGHDVSSHLREVHEINPDSRRVICEWDHCNMELNSESLLRHVEETHMMIVHLCDCRKGFSRKDTLNKHKTSCPSQK